MRTRYDLRRSDNYPYTGKIAYVCSGSGTLAVYTGFPVKSAMVSWVTYPFAQDEEMSSSSESTSSSETSISESSYSESFSSISSLSDLSSLSSESSSNSESSESVSISSESTSSSSSEVITGLPRLYVSGYFNNGFSVTYENIPSQVGFIEFSFTAV